MKETQKYGKKQQKENHEQMRKRKLQNQQDLEQKEIDAEKKREETRIFKSVKKITKKKNVFGKRPKSSRDHLTLRRAVYDRYKRMYTIEP